MGDDEDHGNLNPDAQKNILERVRNLSSESVFPGQENIPAARLNFGLPNPAEAKKGVGPPPGFSNTNLQNKSWSGTLNLGQPSSAGGLQLGSLSTGNAVQGQGLSLSSLATSHLSSLPASCSSGNLGQGQGLSLSSLASSHLSSLPSSSSSGGLQLESLSSSSGAGCLQIGSLSSMTSGPGHSLKSLASSHLSSVSENTQLNSTLMPLSQRGLPASQDKENRPTLGSLASNHLMTVAAGSSSNFNLGLPKLNNDLSNSKPSLNSMANNYLKSETPASSFKIPCLNAMEIPSQRADSPDQQEIDLLSALKIESNTNEKPAIENVKLPKPEPQKEIDLNIFVSPKTYSKVKSILSKKTKSSFGLTLTRKWTRRESKTKIELKYNFKNIEEFKFDKPSPDDVVMEAQKQSRAFNRMNIT